MKTNQWLLSYLRPAPTSWAQTSPLHLQFDLRVQIDLRKIFVVSNIALRLPWYQIRLFRHTLVRRYLLIVARKSLPIKLTKIVR